MSESEANTYRGPSFEELLPKIREELGPDAVITRRREGVVGGFGGFFGKKCVEVEARPGSPLVPTAAARPVLPAARIVDAYDTGEAPQPFEELEPEPEERTSTLVDTLLAQASPFATQ